MKKVIALCVTATLAASLLAACGDTASSVSSTVSSVSSEVDSSMTASSAATSTSGKNLADIITAIEAANPIANVHELDEFALENDFLLTMDNIQEFSGKVSNDQGDAGTILVIRAVPGKAGEIKSQLTSYQDAQTTYWDGYSQFADAKASTKDGRIVEKGDYVVLVFASLENADYAAIDKAVDAALS